jgi:hypothetical protein
MADSKQRRKSIRQQNAAMKKTLEKLRRRMAEGAAPAAEAAAATPAAAAAAPAPEQGGWLKGLLGKGKGAAKSPAGAAVSGILGYLLIDALFKQGMGIAGQVQQGGLQNQALDTQMAAATPEAAAERQMQPITKAQRDYAMMMLMRQLGMQGGPPMLADGEVLT